MFILWWTELNTHLSKVGQSGLYIIDTRLPELRQYMKPNKNRSEEGRKDMD